MLLLPSQHNPAPVFARGEGAVPSSSRLVHPAPSTAGCGYTGACLGTPVLPARCGASDPQGMAWSRPRCRIWPAAAGFSLKSKRVWQPRNHDSVPRACPHPSGCLRRRCRQHPAPRLVQPVFPYPQGPTGVLSWAPARGGSAVPFLTREGIYRKAVAVPERTQPKHDAAPAAPCWANPLLYTQTPSPLRPPASLSQLPA